MTSKLFEKLVDSKNWEHLRMNIKRQSTLKTIASSIRRVLKVKELPSDILPSLFERLRPLREQNKDPCHYTNFHNELFGRVCRFDACCHIFSTCENVFALWDAIVRTCSPHTISTLLAEYNLYYSCAQSEITNSRRLSDVQDLVCRYWELLIADIFQGTPDCCFEVFQLFWPVNSLDDLRQHAALYDWWQKFEAFISFCLPDDGTPILHRLVKGGYPSLLVYFAAKVYGLSERDPKGRIPLHYAADEEPCGKMEKLLTRCNVAEPSLAILLTHLFPQGASYADKDGKLPLTTYLETSAIYISRKRDNSSKLKDVMALIQAVPQALWARDPKTFLMPFLIPAQVDTISNLEMSYTILRENPMVVARGIADPRAVTGGKTMERIDECNVATGKDKGLHKWKQLCPGDNTPNARKRTREK